MNNEDSESEEEILVYAEFEDTVNIDKYRNIHILGADDKNPIIQLDETFFTGKYEHALGTYMFFQQDHGIQGKDPVFDKYPDKCLQYICKTRKLLSMEHAYVTPKEGKESNQQNQEKQEDDVQPVTFKDIQQAMAAFKPYFAIKPNEINNSSKNPSTQCTNTSISSVVAVADDLSVKNHNDDIEMPDTELEKANRIQIEASDTTNIEKVLNTCDIEMESTKLNK